MRAASKFSMRAINNSKVYPLISTTVSRYCYLLGTLPPHKVSIVSLPFNSYDVLSKVPPVIVPFFSPNSVPIICHCPFNVPPCLLALTCTPRVGGYFAVPVLVHW